MASLTLAGGRVLHPNGTLAHGALTFSGSVIEGIVPCGDDASYNSKAIWNAEGLLVLPGIVDVHGDAFERCMMPRPGVHFSTASALLEADRQLLAAGITTAFHGVTCSWEPGLRSVTQAEDVVRTLASVRGRLGCDTRLHLRHEIANVEGEEVISDWMRQGMVHLLAFNDHLDGIEDELLQQPQKAAAYVARTGLDRDSLLDRIDALQHRRPEMEQAVERLAALATELKIAMASHDDDSPIQRRRMHDMGCLLSEFPVDERTAQAARSLGDAVILGAPNIMRGGSHCDRLSAAEGVASGLCTVLASDYHYPSLLGAVFRLAQDDIAFLSDAWALVSANPAEAVGLNDRGVLEPGRRADVVLVDGRDMSMPQVAAVFVAGRCVYSAVDPLRVLTQTRSAQAAE